jgi:hypothetical protein
MITSKKRSNKTLWNYKIKEEDHTADEHFKNKKHIRKLENILIKSISIYEIVVCWIRLLYFFSTLILFLLA